MAQKKEEKKHARRGFLAHLLAAIPAAWALSKIEKQAEELKPPMPEDEVDDIVSDNCSSDNWCSLWSCGRSV